MDWQALMVLKEVMVVDSIIQYEHETPQACFTNSIRVDTFEVAVQ